MAAVREFTLPDLGEGLTSAEIVRWLVAVGDMVAVDQPVVEMETAKAAVEVPCPYGGVVTGLFGEPGQEIAVGAPLITVATPQAPGAPGEGGAGDVGAAGAAGAGTAGAGTASGSGDVGAGSTARGAGGGSEAGGGLGQVGAETDARGGEGSGNVLVGYGTGGAGGAGRPPGRRRRVVPPGAVGRPGDPYPSSTRGPVSGIPGRAGSRAAAPATQAPADQAPATQAPARVGAPAPAGEPRRGAAPAGVGPVAVISPLVRRMAREHGIDLRTLRGSGPEGRIQRADVERAISALAPETRAPGGSAPGAPGAGAADVRPFRPAARTAAEKFTRAHRDVPDATCWVDADATALLAARDALNADAPNAGPGASAGPAPRIGLLALLARICVAALARYPELNATVVTGPDGAATGLRPNPAVHLGVAAHTERGLVVPVVHDAQALGTEALAAALTATTEAAQAGRLSPADLTGGTFTLNNYGVFGVDGSTPILNHPETAMLGVGRITARPWVHEGELAVRQVVQLSLTFDHRACDGATAGRFLREVADAVEQPLRLLRRL